jgi:hypothetical protein
MKGTCTVCKAENRIVAPAGVDGALVCVECAGENPKALREFLGKKGGILASLAAGLAEALGGKAHVITMGSGDRKELSKQVSQTLKEVIVHAYNHGVWIQEIKTTEQSDGLEIDFSIALASDKKLDPDGKPTPETVSQCQA